jgi:anti-sigma28 factor (negative regulator of flagellin synthesis)
MIISRAEINSAVSAYRSVKRNPSLSTVAFDTADRFEASAAASSLLELVAEMASEPFYRAEHVEDLQRRIAEGRYFVPSDEIVDKLLGRLIVDAAAA